MFSLLVKWIKFGWSSVRILILFVFCFYGGEVFFLSFVYLVVLRIVESLIYGKLRVD